jgi:hypothetical protein
MIIIIMIIMKMMKKKILQVDMLKLKVVMFVKENIMKGELFDKSFFLYNLFLIKNDNQRHEFYDCLCPHCADLNWFKRNRKVDLSGRVILVTGGRVKIGFEAGYYCEI